MCSVGFLGVPFGHVLRWSLESSNYEKMFKYAFQYMGLFAISSPSEPIYIPFLYNVH